MSIKHNNISADFESGDTAILTCSRLVKSCLNVYMRLYQPFKEINKYLIAMLNQINDFYFHYLPILYNTQNIYFSDPKQQLMPMFVKTGQEPQLSNASSCLCMQWMLD